MLKALIISVLCNKYRTSIHQNSKRIYCEKTKEKWWKKEN